MSTGYGERALDTKKGTSSYEEEKTYPPLLEACGFKSLVESDRPNGQVVSDTTVQNRPRHVTGSSHLDTPESLHTIRFTGLADQERQEVATAPEESGHTEHLSRASMYLGTSWQH